MIALTAAGLAALGWVLVRAGPHKPPARISPGRFHGVILAETPGGLLTLTDLRTGRVRRLTGLGHFPTSPPPVVSADGKYIFAPAMDVLISLADPARPAKVRTALSYSSRTNLWLASPFANHDSSLIVQATWQTLPVANARTSVQSIASGKTLSLGIADQAAGDPQAAGAFVSVAERGTRSADEAAPDVRLELRDAGARPRVLAAAARLGRLAGVKTGHPVTLAPLPNPQGTMVAVEVSPVTGKGSSGIVVLSRAGHVLGSESAGPGGIPAIAWSRSGTTLAFIGRGTYGPELTQWTIGGQSTTSMYPVGGGAVRRCVWSPDGLAVLCMTGRNGQWLITQPGVLHQPDGRGIVLAWLNAGLGR